MSSLNFKSLTDSLNSTVAPRLAQLRLWYDGRAASEQRLLRVAAIVVPILLLLSVFSALQSSLTKMEKRLQTKRADYAYIQSVAPAIAAAPVPNPSGQSLPALVDAGSREAGITIASTDPVGQNQLRIRVENTSFDTLAGWLVRLQQNEGVVVQNASIDRAAAPGQVSASVTLSRP